MDRDEVMTAVHRRFATADADLANGFAEHATMGAEAMLTLGIDPAAVLAWSQRHEPVPVPHGAPLALAREAIRDELADEEWQPVLRRRVAGLVGGLDAHLFHGLIRTAHATRALEDHDDDAARTELAAGLAAWSVWAGDDRRTVSPSVTAPLDQVLELARRGAAAFAAKPSIFTLHAVTGPMAYLLLAHLLDDDVHAVAASVLTRTHARHATPPVRPADRSVPGPVELATLARQWDAHPAKLVEAALRGHALSGDAAFLDAAAAIMG